MMWWSRGEGLRGAGSRGDSWVAAGSLEPAEAERAVRAAKSTWAEGALEARGVATNYYKGGC